MAESVEMDWKSMRIWGKNLLKLPKIGFRDFAWKGGAKKTANTRTPETIKTNQ